MPINHSAAGDPFSHVIDNRMEKAVNTANPMLKIRTRPNMSPTRPSVTKSTANTTMKPSNIHNR